jgi:hypothetical protein
MPPRVEISCSLVQKHCKEHDPNLNMNKLDSTAWKVQTQTGINGLVFEENIPSFNQIGDHDCLIAVEASSLNYRDIMISNVGFSEYPIHKQAPLKLLTHFGRAHTLSHCLSQSSQARTLPVQFSPSGLKSHASVSAIRSAHTSCRLIWKGRSLRRGSRSASGVAWMAPFAREASFPNRHSCACLQR